MGGGVDRGGGGRKSGGVPQERVQKWVVNMGESNLACHPLGAVLPKAQGRRDSANNFVHLLIVDPTAGKNTQAFSGVWVQPGPGSLEARMGALVSRLNIFTDRYLDCLNADW